MDIIPGTSEAAWKLAQDEARAVCAMDIANLVEEILGGGLRQLRRDLARNSSFRTQEQYLKSLLRDKPQPTSLIELATTPPWSGEIVFVPMVHEFGEERDRVATEFQSMLASFIVARGSPQNDILLLEGLRAGTITKDSCIKDFRRMDTLRGKTAGTDAHYAAMVLEARQAFSPLELALAGRWQAVGVENLWVLELLKIAQGVNEVRAHGALRFAYLLNELRNRIAVKQAVTQLQQSRRPIIIMGALHFFGLRGAAEAAGLSFCAWTHETLKPLFSFT